MHACVYNYNHLIVMTLDHDSVISRGPITLCPVFRDFMYKLLLLL